MSEATQQRVDQILDHMAIKMRQPGTPRGLGQDKVPSFTESTSTDQACVYASEDDQGDHPVPARLDLWTSTVAGQGASRNGKSPEISTTRWISSSPPPT